MDLAPYLKYVDFQSGIIHTKIRPKPPRLVRTAGTYNIVAYEDQYIVIPHSAGPLEIDKVDLSMVPGVFVEKTYHDAIGRIQVVQPFSKS